MSKIKDLLKIKYVNIKPSDSVTSYIEKKVAKHDNESKEISGILCNVSLESSKAGKTFLVTIETAMPHSGFIVREKGNDLYKIIDDISDKYKTRLLKMIGKMHDSHTAGTDISDSNQWIESFMDEPGQGYEINSGSSNLNRHLIVERKKFFDNSPLHVEEAIEIMEMVGRPCFLFRNIDTGRYSVIYRVEANGRKSGYGLLEHRD